MGNSGATAQAKPGTRCGAVGARIKLIRTKPRKKASPIVRWSRGLKNLRALSVRQPWAWLIVNGYKDVENRSRATKYRGPLLIHAGLSRANLSDEKLEAFERRYGVKLPREYEQGGIVGVVDVAECNDRPNSIWHDHGWSGWVLAKPRRLPFRPCKGALSFFKPKFGKA